MTTAAAVTVAVLLGGVAVFQVLLAAGARWGHYAYGGRLAGPGEPLPARYRIVSAVAVLVLAAMAWTVLAAAGLVSYPGGERLVVWLVFGYLVLNTAGNLASPTRFERFGMGALTAVAAVLTLLVALTA